MKDNIECFTYDLLAQPAILSENGYNIAIDYIYAEGNIIAVLNEEGNRMSYTDWNTPQTQTSFTFDRGFTGHEHYDSLHIINANARLYDPVIGRFFSPDRN